MKISRDNMQSILTPINKKVYFDTYDSLPTQYTQIFETEMMKQKTETIQRLGGFGLWSKNNEGNSLNESSMSEGPSMTFTAERYDNGYSITWELVQDDLYDIFSAKGVNGSAKGLAKGLNQTIEVAAANILNNGFSGTGYDGVALFADAHTCIDSASTWDNLASGVMSDANLKLGLLQMRNQLDDAGLKSVQIPAHVIIPPALEFTTEEILFSAGKTATPNNDKNTIPRLTPIVLDFLTSSTAWFLKAKDTTNLVFRWKEKPWFDTQSIPKTVDFFCFGYARFTQGYEDPRGLVGSTGQ